MRPAHRRLLLVLGILLVVGGWGSTRYVDARQQGIRERSRDEAWNGKGDYVSGKVIYTLGILAAAAGAIVVVFSRD